MQQPVAKLEIESISRKLIEFYKFKLTENDNSRILQQPVDTVDNDATSDNENVEEDDIKFHLTF